MSLSHFPKCPKHGNATFGRFTASLGYIRRRLEALLGVSRQQFSLWPRPRGNRWLLGLRLTNWPDWLALVWLWCGFGGALVEPWWSLGVALGWLCGGFVLRSLCLVYAYYRSEQRRLGK